MKRVPLNPGSAEMKKLRAGLERPRAEQASLSIPLPKNEHAARFWSERAWSEFAAVPAMAQIVLALVREGASIDAIASITRISHDEVLHTELARDLAEEMGGYVTDIPDTLPYEPARLALPQDCSSQDWVLNTVVSETVSLELMRARLRRTRHPRIRQILRRVFRDELVHARTGWLLAGQIMPALEAEERREMADQAEALFEMLGTTFASGGLPEDVRREARRIREVTAELGLGAVPPDEADAVCVDTVVEVIAPKLRSLGVPALAG